MIKLKLFLSCMLMVLMCGSVWAGGGRLAVAVPDFEVLGEQVSDDLGRIVAEWCMDGLQSSGRFELIERLYVQAAVSEKPFSGSLTQNSAQQLGQKLHADVLIAGTVMNIPGTIEVKVKIFNLKGNPPVIVESVVGAQLRESTVAVSQKIIDHFPLRGYVIKRDGNSVFVDLGSDVGVRQGMVFAASTEGEPIRHPVTGEVLAVNCENKGTIEIEEVFPTLAKGAYKGAEFPIVGAVVESLPKVKSGSPEPPSPIPEKVSSNKPENKPKPDESANLLSLLRSNDPVQIRQAGKELARQPVDDIAVYRFAAEVLEKGHLRSSQSKMQIDAMSWLCKALAGSGKSEFSPLLLKVSMHSSSDKLRKYAHEAFSLLPAPDTADSGLSEPPKGEITVVVFSHPRSYPMTAKSGDRTKLLVNGKSFEGMVRKVRYVFRLKSGIHTFSLGYRFYAYRELKIIGEPGEIYFIATQLPLDSKEPTPVMLSEDEGIRRLGEYRLKKEFVAAHGGNIKEVPLGTVEL